MHRRQLLSLLTALALPAWTLRLWASRQEPRADERRAPWRVTWAWAGAVTPTSAVVVAKVVGASQPVTLRLRPFDSGAVVQVAALPSGAPDVFRFAATGLRPATAYAYDLVQGDDVWPVNGRLRTTSDGPHAAVILFGSCASTGSNAVIWDTMRAAGPDLLIHMGDMHYENITRDDPARFRRAFERCLTSPQQSAFYRAVPLVYVWDDHDFGGDDSDAWSPSAPAAHRVYREYVPHYPLTGGPSSTIQQAFSVGRVRVIVTDVRSAREAPDGATPSMLGRAQLDWLLAELEAASRTAALVVWANPVPWITRADERTRHGWARYHEERAQIAAHIDRLGLTPRLLMISGDAHMVAMDDGTNSQYAPAAPPERRGFVVVHAAAFDRLRRSKGGPYSLGSRAGGGQFGELRIADNGHRLVATLTCRDRRGRQVRHFSIRMTCVNGTCRVSVPDARTGEEAAHAEHQ